MTSENGYYGNLAISFAHLIRDLWQKESVTVPRSFRHIVGELEKDFAGEDMQDADDFLTFLVDGLHEDTNMRTFHKKAKEPKEKNESSSSSSDDEEVKEYEHFEEDQDFEITDRALEEWSKSLRKNWSFIYFMFYG